jgi:TonB family protein
MKNSLVTLLLSLFISTGFTQNSKFEYTGRLTPAIKKAKLNEANLIYEIMPQFSRYFVLPYNDRSQFDKQVITIYPQAYMFPQDNYNYLFNYVAVEISAICDGKVITSVSKNDTLTAAQKDILNTADLGNDISIKIKFNYKNGAIDSHGTTCKINEGEYSVTVIPQTEAEYPGGFKQFTQYFTKNVFNKMPEQPNTEKIQQAVLKFTIDEEGQIVNARISKTSTDPKIDGIILEATNKMPRWVPAQNAKGLKIKQEFSIPFGGGGC